MQRALVYHPADRHAHQVLGFLCGRLWLVHVHPGTLIANVGQVEQIGIEPHLVDGLLEQRLVRAWRARGHHDAVELVLGDDMLHRVLRVLRASEHVAPRIDHVR